MTTSSVVKINRNSQGLVSALFDTIDRLNAREITPEEARAVSHTARSIVAVAQLELNHRRVAEGAQLKSLSIGAENAGDTPK